MIAIFTDSLPNFSDDYPTDVEDDIHYGSSDEDYKPIKVEEFEIESKVKSPKRKSVQVVKLFMVNEKNYPDASQSDEEKLHKIRKIENDILNSSATSAPKAATTQDNSAGLSSSVVSK